MNVSGGPVARAAKAYGLGPEQIVAVHDDLESPFGRVRAKQGGGLAGHNGLRSLAERVGSREFLRVTARDRPSRVAATRATSPTGCCRRSSPTRIPLR